MEEAVKNRIILILTLFSMIFFIGTMGSCNNARKIKVERDKEIFNRLDAEEKMSNIVREKTEIERKLNSAIRKLTEETVAHQSVKKMLLQEQLANKNLTEELGKVTKLKETLEEDLKEALVKNRSGRARKQKD